MGSWFSDDQERSSWDGAIQLYTVLRPFLFRMCGPDDELAIEDLLNRVLEKKHDEFVTAVRARTMVDLATFHEHDLVEQWTRTDKGAYHDNPWFLLEDKCLSREDLDLLYTGIVACELHFPSYNFTLLCSLFMICSLSLI